MATELSQDTLLYFLQSSGGTVKNSDLLLHFRHFIRDHADQNRNREQFKKFVNSLATVKQIDGVSYVVLRKKFKGGGGEEISSEPPRLSARKNSEPSPENAKLSPAWSTDKPRQKLREVTTPAPPGAIAGKTILPAAGIMLNNNNSNMETHLKLNQKQQQVISTLGLCEKPAAAQVVSQSSVSLSEPFAPDQCTKAQNRVGFGLPPGITPALKHHGETSQRLPVPETLRGREACLQPVGGLHQEPPLHAISLQLQAAPRYIRNRQSYKSAVSVDEDEEEEEAFQIRQCSAGVEQPLSTPLRDMGRAISASSPCILDPPVSPSVVSSSSSSSSERNLPKIYVQDMERETMTPRVPGWSLDSGVGQKGPWAGSRLEPGSVSGASTRQSLPLEAEHIIASPDRVTEVGPNHDAHADHRYSQPASVQLDPRQGLDQSQGEWPSSSHSTVFSPSSDAGPSSNDHLSPGGFGWNSSYEDLHTRAGDIYDREEAESSAGSTSSPPLGLQSPVARRLSSHSRSRMCRSLGADLDQLLQEESRAAGGSEAARLNRLHLISSSLSLRYNVSSSSLSSCSTPPRCQSLAELDEGVKGRRGGGRRSSPITTSSTARHEGPSRQSMVPLEPREHDWLVKGASGAWPDIYTLFREDSSLLNRQDFISGFTMLHWIAKHGDHRVLNTLWYGVEKAGLTFNINAKSTCGHTPLHIAAIHDNQNIMRLLVNKFNADVKLRDTSGKKAWQYLSSTAQPDVFQLLGAPLRPAGEGDGGVVRENQEQRSQTPRRRRHHLSFASSGERPLTMSGTTRVKRSTSIAAFLKHRSLLPFHGHQSDSSV